MTTIVFDVGNVLLRWDVRLILRDILPDAEIDAFLDEIGFHVWNLEQDRGRTWDEGVRIASNGHPDRADLIRRLHDDWHRAVPGPIDGSVEILRRLHASGQPVYAITNFSAEKWDECLERFDFLNMFEDAVVSAHERLLKPDPEIYRRLLDRNGLEAERCLFIDDSAANVAGAEKIGMEALHFTDASKLLTDLNARGVTL